MGRTPLKVAMIGTGGIAKTHMPGWAASPHAEVVAACDVFEPAVTKFGADWKIDKLTTSPKDVINDPDSARHFKMILGRQFEDIEQKVDETLYNQKMQPALREYLTTLRKESFITIAPGFVDTGAAKGGGLDFPKDEEE